MVHFLKTLVLPRFMVKYRMMSALVAVLIFLASANIINFPFASATKDAVLNSKTEYPYQALLDIDEHETPENLAILQEIVSMQCAVDADRKLTCENTDLFTDGVYAKDIVYVKDNITKKIHITIDYRDTPQEITQPFSSQTTPFEDQVENYWVNMTRNTMYFQAFQSDIESQSIEVEGVPLRTSYYILSYSNSDPNFTLKLDEAQTKMLGTFLVDEMILGYANFNASMTLFSSAILTIIFPLILTFFLWIFLKKSGRLKRFKEYYNIAAITSILPLVITFAVAWVYPLIINYYIFIFAIYYLFNLYKINNSQELL